MCGYDPFWENKTIYKWSGVWVASFARAPLCLCLPTPPLKPTHGGKSPQPCGDRVALLWVSKLGLWVTQMIVRATVYAYGCFVCMLSVCHVHTEPVGSPKGVRFPGIGVTHGCELPCGCQDSNPHVLEKATSTLVVEPSSGITPFLLPPPPKKTFLREKASDFRCLFGSWNEENTFLSRGLETELCSLVSGLNSDSKWLFLEE